MLAAINEDLPEAVGVAFLQHEDVLRVLCRMLEQPPREPAGDAQRTAGHAVEVRVVGFLQRRHLLLRPRQHQRIEFLLAEQARDGRIAAARPDAREIDRTVRELRRGALRLGRSPGSVFTAEPSREVLRARLRQKRRGEPDDGDRSNNDLLHGVLRGQLPSFGTKNSMPSAPLNDVTIARSATERPAKPSTITCVPTGSVFLDHPPRSRAGVLAISKFHVVTLPPASVTST